MTNTKTDLPVISSFTLDRKHKAGRPQQKNGGTACVHIWRSRDLKRWLTSSGSKRSSSTVKSSWSTYQNTHNSSTMTRVEF